VARDLAEREPRPRGKAEEVLLQHLDETDVFVSLQWKVVSLYPQSSILSWKWNGTLKAQ